MGELSLFKKTFSKKTKKIKIYDSLLNKKKSLVKKKYISFYKKLYKIDHNTCNKKSIPNKIKLYSNLCYYSYKKNKPTKYKNYTLDINYNTKYYQCYYNKINCIIVFRGTKLDKRDFSMDYNIALNDMKKNKYFETSLDISKEIIEKYNNKKIILTGHSLGGTISLFVMDSLKHKIHKTYVFNPGITILPYKISILKDYCSNKKNHFIIKLGDVISNGIIRHKPKNLICLKSDIYDNIIDLHKISCFL